MTPRRGASPCQLVAAIADNLVGATPLDTEGLMKKFVVYLLIAFSALGSVAVAIDMTPPAYAGKQPPKYPH
jgi:hypothetical protein